IQSDNPGYHAHIPSPQIQTVPSTQQGQSQATLNHARDAQEDKKVQTQSQNRMASEKSVQLQNGRIVYNRHYNDIPKGSYTGGETYTVKHGDTLFYIAWITGNDFRDLAQRNQIDPPYHLNIG